MKYSEECFQNEIPSRRLGIPCFCYGSTTRPVMPVGKGLGLLVLKGSCTCPYPNRPLGLPRLGSTVLDICILNWKLFEFVSTLGSLSRQIQSETFGPGIVWLPSLFLWKSKTSLTTPFSQLAERIAVGTLAPKVLSEPILIMAPLISVALRPMVKGGEPDSVKEDMFGSQVISLIGEQRFYEDINRQIKCNVQGLWKQSSRP